MLKNKKFARYSILMCIVGILLMFFYSGLQTDHLNIIEPFVDTAYGWNSTKASNPSTWGSIFNIVFYLICGAALIKFGPKKFMVPGIIVLGLATMGIALSDGNYAIYSICLFLTRVLILVIQMGMFMLCANWFIKFRGRILGIVTMGSPLFSICGVTILTYFVNQTGTITAAYITMGIVLVVLALAVAFGFKDTPEDAGLYPDGLDTPPHIGIEDNVKISLGQLVKMKRFWLAVIPMGALMFVLNALMSSMALRYIMLTDDASDPQKVWLVAVKWLAVGAGCGIPMSFVLGYIDDKLGSVKAMIILEILFFAIVIPLWIMPVGGSVPLMVVWAFGVACATGGVPTMHPCITTYLFGRKNYQAANKWVMTIQAIPYSMSVLYMTSLFNANLTNVAYIGLIIMVVIAIVGSVLMLNVEDANLADRDYGKNAEDANLTGHDYSNSQA